MSADPADLTVSRSRDEIVAEVLARLILARLLGDQTALGIKRACRVAKIDPNVVMVAARRIQAGTMPAPSALSHHVVVTDPTEERIPMGRGRKTPSETARVLDDGTVERRCCRCKTWKPAAQFAIKSTRTGARSSMCDPCRQSYQRSRYLDLQARDQLSRAGLRFVWEAGDPRLLCAACGRPFHAGDDVAGETTLRHAGCVESPPNG